jgi:hypothetical protein
MLFILPPPLPTFTLYNQPSPFGFRLFCFSVRVFPLLPAFCHMFVEEKGKGSKWQEMTNFKSAQAPATMV